MALHEDRIMSIDAGVLTQLTEHYDKDLLEILFKDGKVTSPVFAMAEAQADDDGMGRGYVVRVATSEGAAVAADPAIADLINNDGAAGGRPTRQRWVIQPVSLDAPFGFTRDEVDSISGRPKDEQFDVVSDEMDKAVTRIRNLLCEQVSGKGWGALAQTTAQSSTGFTVDPALVNRFPIGARLVASITEDTDVLLGSPAGTPLRVTAVNTDTGVVTLSGNPATTWASDQDLFIFRQGNRPLTDPGADQSLKMCISGLEAWIDPAGAALWGVTRAGDPNLSGFGVDCTNMDTAQGLLAMANRGFAYGRDMDIIVVSGVTWTLLQQDYDPARVVNLSLGDYKIGFTGYKMATVFGESIIVPDPFIKPGTAYGGPFRDKKFGPKLKHSRSKLVNLDDLDGKQFERQNASGARTFKGQFYFRGNMSIGGPGMYVKATGLPTA